MDVSTIEQKLASGESLKIKYRYPCDTADGGSSHRYGVRTDKLVDVSVELKRFYTNFRGETPIWLEADEIIDISPDDGVYDEFPME